MITAIRKEAAFFFGILVAATQIVLLYFTAIPTSRWAYLAPFVTLLGAWATRQKVVSEHTLNQAGFTMEILEARAKSDQVTPVQPN